MKILAIIGSPRGKSSGYKIVRMIEDRMKSLGEVEFEYLFLKDAKLRPCLGCYACMALGEDKCPLRDDRAAIEREMLAADGVILSSPVHVLNVSGLMKNFIDRFAYSNHRPRFHRQKILTLANTGGSGTRRTLSSLKSALGGGRIVRGLGIATPPWPQTLRAVAAKARVVDRTAKAFYRACLDDSIPRPTFYAYIMFLVHRRAGLEWRRYLPADYAFYAGKDYYYPAKISRLKAAAAKLVMGIAARAIKAMGPGSIPWSPSREILPCPIIFHSPATSSCRTAPLAIKAVNFLTKRAAGAPSTIS